MPICFAATNTRLRKLWFRITSPVQPSHTHGCGFASTHAGVGEHAHEELVAGAGLREFLDLSVRQEHRLAQGGRITGEYGYHWWVTSAVLPGSHLDPGYLALSLVDQKIAPAIAE